MFNRKSPKAFLWLTVWILAVCNPGSELAAFQKTDVDVQKSGNPQQAELAEYSGRQPFQCLEAGQPAVELVMSAEMARAGRYEVPFFAAGVSENLVVADIGCGSGKFAIQLATAVGEDGVVYCRDIDKAALETLRNAVLGKQLANLDIAVSEKNDVALPDDSVELALISDVFQFVLHQEQAEGFCQSLLRAMKPGGIVVVTFVTSGRLFNEKWKEDYQGTLDAFTRYGFEPGMRYIISDEKRPVVVLEFRKPE